MTEKHRLAPTTTHILLAIISETSSSESLLSVEEIAKLQERQYIMAVEPDCHAM